MKTKVCSVCRNEKSENEFSWKHKGKQRASWCKVCFKEYWKDYYRENKKVRIQKANERNIQKQKETREFLWGYLKEHPCVDCGESDPIVLDFDHVTGKKEFSVSLAPYNRVSMKKLQREISKCEIRCANCHRRKTAKEDKTYRHLFSKKENKGA